MVTAVDPAIAIRSRSPKARGRYIRTTEQAVRSLALDDPRAVLEECVAWLEIFHLGALTWEFIHERGITSLEELRTYAKEMDHHLRSAVPDVTMVERGIRQVLGDLPALDDAVEDDWFRISWSQVVRSFDAIVAECPIEGLEHLGKLVDEPRLAHCARNAYDALRAFVRRHHSDHAEIMRIVGEQYRSGHIRLRDAARLLGMSTSDAVFELEQDGYSRAPAAIALTDSDREEIYQRLRQRRLQRSGPPTVDPDLVERDVIASERIESVDARAWIRRR